MADSHFYILTGRTALYYWLHCDRDVLCVPEKESDDIVRHARYDSQLPPLSETAFGPPPYELIINEPKRGYRCKHLIARVATKRLPDCCLVRISDNLYVTSPVFTLCRLALSLSKVEIIEIATNLCGSYYLEALGGIKERSSRLLTASYIAEFCASHSSLYGCRKVSSVVSYICDGAASPMETKLLLLLTLPCRWGGYAFVGAKFNHEVTSPKLRTLSEQQLFRVDIAYVPEKLGIEFEGAAYHMDYSKDRRRVNALESLKWKMISVDKAQLYDEVRFERTAHQIAVLLRRRLRRSKTWWLAHTKLREQLNLC